MIVSNQFAKENLQNDFRGNTTNNNHNGSFYERVDNAVDNDVHLEENYEKGKRKNVIIIGD